MKGIWSLGMTTGSLRSQKNGGDGPGGVVPNLRRLSPAALVANPPSIEISEEKVFSGGMHGIIVSKFSK